METGLVGYLNGKKVSQVLNGLDFVHHLSTGYFSLDFKWLFDD